MKTAYPYPHERLLAPIEETRLEWRGESTPFQARHDDVYFALDSGFDETEAIFIRGNDLPERFEKWRERTKPFVVGELGFGTGLNFLLTAEEFLKRNSASRLYFISTEKYPIHRGDHREFFEKSGILARFSLAESLLAQLPGGVPGFHLLSFLDSRIQLLLLIGDANDTLDQLEAKVDAWYLDGFTPAKNPDLWSDSVFQSIARLSHSGTTASSYTAAGWVRRALVSAGFSVEKRPGFGKKRESIRASYRGPVQPLFQRTHPWFRFPEPMKKTTFEISGAGIAGLELSLRLVRGGGAVKLHDPQFNSAASKNPIALAMPQFARSYNALHHLTAQALSRWTRVIRSGERIPGLDRTGAVRLLKDGEMPEHLESALAWMPFEKEALGFLDEEGTGALTGGTFREKSLRIDSAFTVRLPEYLAHLKESLGRRAEWLDQEPDHPTIRADGSRAGGGHPLWSSGVHAMRGQIAKIPYDARSFRTPVSRNGYLIPGFDGRTITIGGTFERGERRESLDLGYRPALWEHWPELNSGFPSVSDPSVEGWMGFRTTTRDHLPICGMLPEYRFFEENYSDIWRGKKEYPDALCSPESFALIGLGSKGVLFSRMLADVLGGLLLGEPLSLEWSQWLALHPARFLARNYSVAPK